MSQTFKNNQRTSHMNQASVNVNPSFIPNGQAPEVLNPGMSSLDNPSVPVTSQAPTVLMRGAFIVASGWNYGLNALIPQSFPYLVAVIAFVGDEPFGLFAPVTRNLHGLERRDKELRLRRGSRVHVKSERSTLAINQYHKLRSLASLGFSDARPPFLAEANVPSTKHSFQWIMSLSSSSARNVLQSFSSVPSSVHLIRRRWTALFEPYRSGSALQGAPDQRIHKMPSKQLRSLETGRPPLRSFLRQGIFRTGKTFSTFSHWASVNPPFQLMFSSWAQMNPSENMIIFIGLTLDNFLQLPYDGFGMASKYVFYIWLSLMFLWYGKYAKTAFFDRPLILNSVVVQFFFNLVNITWIILTAYFLMTRNGKVVGYSLLGIFLCRFSSKLTSVLETAALMPFFIIIQRSYKK